MELPAALRAAIEQRLDGVPLAELRKAASVLSNRYRAETQDGRMHLDAERAVEAYLAARMPATFAAVAASMAAIVEALPDFAPESLLDVGAGPGTALWAAADCWPSLRTARMLEASEPAKRTGSALARALNGVATEWISGNATGALASLPDAGLVTLAYVLDELPTAALAPLVDTLWSRCDGVLLIVEPGTPAGWRRILEARSRLIALGAHIVAPCPHAAPCPLVEPDWCHFAQRLPRSRLHRLAKDGDAPFEDEKFIYIAASRWPAAAQPARVLAPPRQGKPGITLKLCEADGAVVSRLVQKRDGAAFKTARRLDWGDAL